MEISTCAGEIEKLGEKNQENGTKCLVPSSKNGKK